MQDENNSKYMNTEFKPSVNKLDVNHSKTPFNTDVKPPVNRSQELDIEMYYDELNNYDDGMQVEETDNYVSPDMEILEKSNYITPEEVLAMQNINGNIFFPQSSEFQPDYSKLEQIYSESYVDSTKIYSDEYLDQLDSKFSKKGIKGGNFGDLFKSQLKISKSNGVPSNASQMNNVNATPQHIPTPNYISSSHN